ncbi:polyamine ABC transporter substrate-binding protein [Rhizobiaceae bacterium n13]|uniref:Putrescine-binding periplasmic protein n=1 Tax=Ferirhizobium litorale TaxID=2927786 RepID=A0AAE3QEX5_9HYPH|nr:polyamine ABC transporter substrate-binding protein [Fererhizobium litorale]MDI7863458.1 polyamine ABC transporter substrate-binding protein [Fererhizobium litorale]MDI7922265.1 polyamine ABC transporter substrate-binding protein [Fererhizobium litorale]
MKNYLLRFAAAAMLTASFAAAASAEDRVVNVYNWSDYIDESILQDFTKETGIKVVYDVFDSNETLETKLLAGGTGYDVVVPTGNFLQRQIQAGVFQKLDKSKLPNLANMWDEVSQRVAVYDPGNEYAIDYMWGTTGIGYNVAKAKEILGTDAAPGWDAVFNPEIAAKFKDCGIYVLDTADEIVPAALNYLGLDPNSKDAGDLEKAGELLASVRPNIRKFHSSEYINALANGDICLALGWSGDVLQARDRAAEAGAGVEVNYTIPAGGALMWFDMMAIPADAPHVEEAHIFLNYMMRPDVIAKASNYVFYANGNKASQALIDKEVLDDPAIYPPAETMAKLYTKLPYDPKTQRVVTRIWTKVVTGQ